MLQYQVVLPGQYLPARLPVPIDQLIADESLQPTANPAYFAAANWTNVSMLDNGAGVDAAAGDSTFSVALPPQSHRTLVRYRIVVTDALYHRHPDLPEGQLAKLRAAVVNMRALAGVARGLGVGDHVRLGRGEETTGGRDKSSILADTLEALIGAAYLSAGIEPARELVHRLIDPLMESSATLGAGLDWKTSLQELSADLGLGVPEYLIEDDGPDHMKTFVARVRVGEQVLGNGTGRSKKEAEQGAAETAYREIKASQPAAAPAAGQAAADA